MDTLRADNLRLRRLLRLSEEQARAVVSDQAALTGAPASPVTMGSSSAEKVRFFFDLFRCRTDVYAVRWENRRDGRSGWMPAIKGYWRKRRDGLEDLIYHQLGSHHVAIDQPGTGQLPVDSSDLLTPHPVLHLHPTEFHYRGDADPAAPGGMAEIYRALVADHARLDQIVADVLTAAETGANILVLTTWVDHLNAITDRLQAAGKSVTVLSGGIKARERRQITDQLANHSLGSDPLLIVGTSSFIGEGFDCPALDTLFLAAPITFKNRLVQYIGRVTRPYPSKSTATVHDYHDEQTPVIASSLKKRAPGYIKMGFPDPRKILR